MGFVARNIFTAVSMANVIRMCLSLALILCLVPMHSQALGNKASVYHMKDEYVSQHLKAYIDHSRQRTSQAGKIT